VPGSADRGIIANTTGMRASDTVSTILRAVTRARAAILSVALTYAVLVAIGLVAAPAQPPRLSPSRVPCGSSTHHDSYAGHGF
jgi:hypothetical protein